MDKLKQIIARLVVESRYQRGAWNLAEIARATHIEYGTLRAWLAYPERQLRTRDGRRIVRFAREKLGVEIETKITLKGTRK